MKFHRMEISLFGKTSLGGARQTPLVVFLVSKTKIFFTQNFGTEYKKQGYLDLNVGKSPKHSESKTGGPRFRGKLSPPPSDNKNL